MPLRNLICGLQKSLMPLDCAQNLRAAISHYNDVGQLILGFPRTLWEKSWPQDLPHDLGEMLQRWMFPAFEKMSIDINMLLDDLVVQWHRILSNVINHFCKQKKQPRVLCGFNVVNDLIFYLDSGETFHRLLQAWGDPALGSCSTTPGDFRDALACLIKVLNNPAKHGKFYPNLHVFQQILRNTCNAGLYYERFVGGAAGNNAHVLGHMGVNVHLHCPYPSNQLNWHEMANSVQFLQFNGSSFNLVAVAPGKSGLPCRTTVGIQSIPVWGFPSLGVVVNEPGRTLFIGQDPVFAPRPWNSVEVVWQGQTQKWPGKWDHYQEVWPYPALFSHHEVQGQTLRIYPVDAQYIHRLVADQGGYAVALLRDVGFKPDLFLLQQARKKQLDALRESGVPIHVELAPKFDFAFLKYLIQGSPREMCNRWSAALNPDELIEITDKTMQTSSYDSITIDPYLFPGHPIHDPDPICERLLQRFVRAYHLLKILEFDWIYVHGNEIDLVIWRRKACRMVNFGEKARDAMLLAKMAVVANMIERAVPTLKQYVTQHLQQGTALAAKGFWALIVFAEEFSEWVASRYSEQGLNKDTILKSLLYNGYCEVNDFGIAIAPVFWPSTVQNLNATGAGDYSSAVVATCIWGVKNGN